MTTRIPLNDTVAGKQVSMWEVDAEEALRYDPVRYTPVVTKQTPAKKNPGGRGY